MEPTNAREAMDLRRFAREHRLHYEVRSEAPARSVGDRSVAHEVRLFASHDGPPPSTPTCDRCQALRQELGTFARQLGTVAGPEQPGAVELVPDPGALYTARDDPGRDEVMLAIRLAEPARRDDSVLSRLQRELAAAGVARQE